MRIFLLPLGLLYKLIHGLRRGLYQWGVLRPQRLKKTVISVGNLTVGGTGKTPFIDVLLTQLESQNLRCCVLTRGYGRKSTSEILVSAQSSPEEVGDEPLWLCRRHPQAAIVVGANRAKAASLGGEVDIYLLDDGLQHLSLHRDLEITLVDATRPLWHFRPLPWGYGRDSLQVLKRSDLVILTRSNQASDDQLDCVASLIFDQGVLDVAECFVHFERATDILSGTDVQLQNQKVALVSAIGHPESFEKVVKGCNVEVVFHERRRDHWVYSSSEISEVEKKALALGASHILTTEKDAVKIQKWLDPSKKNIPWISVATKITFDPELPRIYDLVSHSSH